MSKTILLLVLLLPFFAFSQDDDDELYVTIKQKLEKDAEVIGFLKKENQRLKSKVEILNNNTRTSNRELQEAMQELLAKNLLLQEKENELRLLQSNIDVLVEENKGLQQLMSHLSDRLVDLTREVEEKNKKIFEDERKFVENLDEKKKELFEKARIKAIEEILLEKGKPIHYFGLAVGLGPSFSGLGGSILYRFGKRTGMGMHIGAGYLPDFYQSEGIYVNGGVTFYPTNYKTVDFFIDLTFNQLMKPISGYEYKNFYSATVGGNIFILKKLIGLRPSVGISYTDDIIPVRGAIEFGLLFRIL